MRKMGWMLSTCVAAALLVLCRGQNIEHEGRPQDRLDLLPLQFFFVCIFIYLHMLYLL